MINLYAYFKMQIQSSTRKDKRYVAIFENKKIHFGSKGEAFIDHADKDKKKAYLARHRVNEDWTNPEKAGTLSRYILWDTPSLSKNISRFIGRFEL